jgi:DNA-binding NtrC family response regulator
MRLIDSLRRNMQEKNTTILVADDKPDMLLGLHNLLEKEGYRLVTAERGDDALELLRANDVDLAICDIQMPGLTGMQVLESAGKEFPGIPFIMITGYASIESAIQAIKKGAYDYISKPFNNEAVLLTVERALERKRMQQELEELRKKLGEEFPEGIVGKSHKMRDIFALVKKISSSGAPVLLLGESGTGKELIARAIHGHSARSRERFVAINTAALPETLLESELFGYFKGAFTGADSDKKGLFVEASGGTLFLDEIGSMPLAFQSKLLRVLQEQEVVPLGGSEPISIDARVISATNIDLEDAITRGAFRSDLLYRLNVIEIEVPALRERMEDIPDLVEHFVVKYCTEHKVAQKKVAPPVMREFMKHPWPGNVRELENAIHRAVVVDGDGKIGLDDVQIRPPGPAFAAEESSILDLFYKDAKQKVQEEFQERYIRNLLQRCRGNIQLAANTSGLTRAAIYRIKGKYGL